MKVPTEHRTSDTAHYSPYSSATSPHTFPHPPPLPSSRSRPTPSREVANPLLESPGLQEDQPQYKVARAISSCTRCRSRKQRCDGKLPACSACERAKVECIGFDAISKTNVSRNYLHSLEQEITSLRAQVAALSSNGDDAIGQTKRGIALGAAQAVSNMRPDLMIDPSLQSEGNEGSLRSPWDSPSMQSAQRRHSDYPYSPAPLGGEPPRSPYFANRPHPTGQPAGVHATSLTRMVHDAALRTGHAQDHAAVLNPAGPSSMNGSERGSNDSPAAADGFEANGGSPQDAATPRSAPNGIRRPPSASPLAPSSQNPKIKRRPFSIPPLPPQPAVERLVAAYVDFVGVTAPIIHIPSLGKQLIKIREGRDVEQSDIFVVMMVLALSTMASSRFVEPPDELRACSEAFHAEAMKHLDAVFEEQSYVGLQAILLLVWYSLLNPDKGSIWFLVGLATRTCVDLGFHNEHNAQVEQLDALELDMRRRLFWCAYKMDRLMSQSLGRPPSIPDGFINVSLPSYLHDVDIHPGHYGPLQGEPCSYKAVFLHTAKLRQLQSEILTNTFGIHSSEGVGPGPAPEWFDDCFERLKSWLASAPEPRGTVSTEGYAISFHNSALLLYRPSPGCPRPGRKAMTTVLASSSYIIRIYRRMQLNNRISWLWMTSHFSFMAGLSFLYAFFNLSMGGGAGVATLDEAMMDIESCLAVLEYLSPRVPSAAACHDTMKAVSKAILDQIGGSEPAISRSSSDRSISPRRNGIRGVPISSSRDDPLPNEGFPAPLPAITLPYELSLLDNLFLNPMAPHHKASDYTNGNKNRVCQIANEVRAGYNHANASESSYGAPPQGFPPGAFQGGYNKSLTGGGGSNGLGAYGMAAVGGAGGSTNAQSGTTDTSGFAQTQQAHGEMDPNGFDVFSFLMDEEGGLGGNNWDALEVPADFSLWS